MPVGRAPPLVHNRPFLVYWAGQALSSLGDGFAAVATPLLVLRASGSVARMGAVTAAMLAGQILAGVFAGLVVDRVDRRSLMIACDLARALLWALVPLVFTLAGPSMPLLFAVSALSALAGNLFYVACFAAVPGLVPHADLLRANSLLTATYAFMSLLGPLISGIVCLRLGPLWGIGVNAASFLASAASIAAIELRPPDEGDAVPSVPPSALRDHGRLASFLAGARFLGKTPALRAVALALGGTALLMAARTDLVVYHLEHERSAGAGAVGVVLGVAALGAFLAGTAAPSIHRRLGPSRSWLAAGVLATAPIAALLVLGASAPPAALAALLLLSSFGETLRGIASQSLRHQLTPDRILGRVTAVFWAAVDLPAAAGALLLTAIAGHVGASRTLAFAGAAALVLALASGGLGGGGEREAPGR